MVAIDRFFRAYVQHCQAHDVDTLFQLLNSLHSLNDQLKSEHNIDFFDIPEFITLKALRNYLHHSGDITENIIFADFSGFSVSTDLIHMCLIEKEQLDSAIDGMPKKFKTEQEKIINNTVHYYGNYVNIAPAIFNIAATIILKLKGNGIEGNSEEYRTVKSAVENDLVNGIPIRVSGKICCHLGNVNEVIERIYKRVKSSE